jgi:hypothetical protein
MPRILVIQYLRKIFVPDHSEFPVFLTAHSLAVVTPPPEKNVGLKVRFRAFWSVSVRNRQAEVTISLRFKYLHFLTVIYCEYDRAVARDFNSFLQFNFFLSLIYLHVVKFLFLQIR